VFNHLQYARVDSTSYWATLKTFVNVLLMGMLVLKRAISFAHRSLKPLIKFGFKLL
jgi:hypothetical protein